MTTEQNIKELLMKVKEPEQGVPLTDTKMIQSIKVDDDKNVTIHIGHESEQYPFRTQLINSIKKELTAMEGLGEIEVNVGQKPSQPLMNEIPLPNIKNVIVVSSGKGGVGKSTVSVYIARALEKMGLKVGLLDADAYGPNIPNILNCFDRPGESEDNKILPVPYEGMHFLSLGSMLEPGQAVVWRGPMLHKLLSQFFADVKWGELDYLVVDLPPGTGDVQLSVVQSVRLAGAIVVTTPQDLSVADVQKGIDMFKQVNVDILGVIENMSYFQCDECGAKKNIFGEGGGSKVAKQYDLPLLTELPLDPALNTGTNDKALKYFNKVAEQLHEKLK